MGVAKYVSMWFDEAEPEHVTAAAQLRCRAERGRCRDKGRERRNPHGSGGDRSQRAKKALPNLIDSADQDREPRRRM